MASDKIVLVGVQPEVIAIDPGDHVVWYSNAGTIKIEFDPQRSPFNANVFQAPADVRLSSGAPRPGLNPGSYRYRLSINDVFITHGEVMVRAK